MNDLKHNTSIMYPQRIAWRCFVAAVVMAMSLIVDACAYADEYEPLTTVQSPDGRIRLTIGLMKTDTTSRLAYQIARKAEPVIVPSCIRFSLSSGDVLGDALSDVTCSETIVHRNSWKPLYGERATIEDHYQSVSVACRDASTGRRLEFDFRCYDAGVAFRTTITDSQSSEKCVIAQELTEFNFDCDPLAWCTTNAQGLYQPVMLSEMGGDIERPLTLRLNDNQYVALAEARLIDYARTNLRKSIRRDAGVLTHLFGSVEFRGDITTPWRVVMMAESPAELLARNDLILSLNDPCEIEDTSWIEPGKVLREITLTTRGGEASIDFAKKHNFKYVEFDAGWYGHEYDEDSDATTISLDPLRSQGPFDLHHLIKYGQERGIGVIVYVNRRALERQLDEILPLYKKWGVRGVKYGFVRVGSQEWTQWLHEAIRKAAEHQLMVDVHDEYRPTGYSRTYPNLMTQEGVRGDEATPSASQTLTTLFTRSLAGATDFTVCYFDDRVAKHWSHAHQLAKPICFYSPWQFLFWYDTPLQDERVARRYGSIQPAREIELFAALPTTWDDTRILCAEIGELAVIARRSGQEWFVGALNGETRQQISVPLDFLAEATDYVAHIYRDDPTSDSPTGVSITQRPVDHRTTLELTLDRNGGQAMRIAPLDGAPEQRTTSRAISTPSR